VREHGVKSRLGRRLVRVLDWPPRKKTQAPERTRKVIFESHWTVLAMAGSPVLTTDDTPAHD